jgi:hypothetical protein
VTCILAELVSLPYDASNGPNMNASTTDPNWVQLLAVAGTALSSSFSLLITLLYYILYPVGRLLVLLWLILAWLATPFIRSGQFLLNLILIPWRIFASLEVCLHNMYIPPY